MHEDRDSHWHAQYYLFNYFEIFRECLPEVPGGLIIIFLLGQTSEGPPWDTVCGEGGGAKTEVILNPITTARCGLEFQRGDPDLLCFEIPTTTSLTEPHLRIMDVMFRMEGKGSVSVVDP